MRVLKYDLMALKLAKQPVGEDMLYEILEKKLVLQIGQQTCCPISGYCPVLPPGRQTLPLCGYTTDFLKPSFHVYVKCPPC